MAKEINGRELPLGRQVSGFGELKDDGSTLCGNWLYSGSFTEAGNMMARRGQEDPTGLGLYPNWAWNWPANRRILYNRASADGEGKPWDPTRALRWDGKNWVGDVPDTRPTRRPTASAHSSCCPKASPSSLRPTLPRVRSRNTTNPSNRQSRMRLHPKVSGNPLAKIFHSDLDPLGTSKDFPYVGTHLSPDRALPLLDQTRQVELGIAATFLCRDAGSAGS